ncbi:MAG TPA: hypothetical protein VGP63_30505 [Planctomycetaceae bacterium]|jgi:hypothetical protein|nr:hypothetical protein [Planctomycetaceae bacterium]
MTDFTLSCPRCGKAFAIRNRQAGQRYLCPHCRQPFSLQPAGEPASAAPEKGLPEKAQASADVFQTPIPDDLPGGLAAVRRKRSKKSALRLFGPAGFVAAIACVGVLFLWDRFERSGGGSNSASSKHHPTELPEGSVRLQTAVDRKPVQLLLAPAGARIVIHLRPSRFWTATGAAVEARKGAAGATRGSELLSCVGPLADWARDQIDNWCLYPPSQVDEAVFAYGLRSPGEPPDVSVLVGLVHPVTLSEVDHRFGGVRSEKGPLPVFLKGDRALVVRDELTFAVGPAESSQEMAEAREQPNPTDASIEELLKETDRDSDLCVVFRPDDIDRFRDSLVPPQWAGALHELANWFDPAAVEGVVLSVRLDDPMRVRLVTRALPIVYGPRLAETLKQRLDRLPTELVKYVERLQPAVPGSRKLIGRLPAMCRALAIGTQSSAERRLVSLESILPERAAPNLSLATYLLLAEGPPSAIRPTAAPVANKREGPKTLAARLQTTVDVDFRRTPLSEAFESIGGDIGVTFELDGGAFKLAGYTKNMPQTFQIKGSPAIQSLRKILTAYPKLALVGDEARGVIVVTTSEAAAAQHKTPMALGNSP